jgi:alkanesulfonate monooxygenase SsuD/methylene tetrahydromethanopterin reductase-like flavin-dependent oxidoreductase (luciferase family)
MVVKPFRFGVVFTDEMPGPEWAEYSRRLEGEGFSTLLVADHYGNPMACGPLLMATAAATTTLRIGSYVYDNDFRHPALLAKEAATIDVLLLGSAEAMADPLIERRERWGLSYIVGFERDLETFLPLARKLA